MEQRVVSYTEIRPANGTTANPRKDFGIQTDPASACAQARTAGSFGRVDELEIRLACLIEQFVRSLRWTQVLAKIAGRLPQRPKS